MTTPEALKILRKQLGWTQKRLAAHLRKNEHTVKRWEMGLFEPNNDAFEKLAGMCDGELSEFFARKAGISEHALFDASRSGADQARQDAVNTLLAKEKPHRELILKMPPDVGRHHSQAQRAIDILAQAAAQGSEFAKAELTHFAEQLLEKAGHAERALKKPAGEVI
jgi:transcriptional regulator with XRE-family HTH domain